MLRYYAFIQDDKIIGSGNEIVTGGNITCVEITEEIYNNIDRYIWDGKAVILDPDYYNKQLEKAKEVKYEEANIKAFEYLESGEAVFEYAEDKSIEATDGNIAKLGLALVNFILQQDYTSTIEWNTKENENVQLNAEQLQGIVAGLQAIQAVVWTVKFPAYNALIEEAQTVEEVENIVIDYSQGIPEEDENEETEPDTEDNIVE